MAAEKYNSLFGRARPVSEPPRPPIRTRYFKWPREALHAVSKHFVSRYDLNATSAVRDELYLAMANAHYTVSQVNSIIRRTLNG
jgi:hypothetical protein